MDTELTVVLLVLFLALSAFFSSSETAYFALQRVRVAHLRRDRRTPAPTVSPA